jgi:hypothetical protein
MPVLHVSQLADVLGLPWRAPLPPDVLAADTVTLLAAWASGIAPLEALLAPTPSRGRSLRNLTVNVHHPFELLPRAWGDGDFRGARSATPSGRSDSPTRTPSARTPPGSSRTGVRS